MSGWHKTCLEVNRSMAWFPEWGWTWTLSTLIWR